MCYLHLVFLPWIRLAHKWGSADADTVPGPVHVIFSQALLLYHSQTQIASGFSGLDIKSAQELFGHRLVIGGQNGMKTEIRSGCNVHGSVINEHGLHGP